MKEMSLLSEGKTEGLYHLQTVPTETYVLNYVLASTIGKFRSGREQKNRTPKSAKKSVNTKKKSGILRLPIFGLTPLVISELFNSENSTVFASDL